MLTVKLMNHSSKSPSNMKKVDELASASHNHSRSTNPFHATGSVTSDPKDTSNIKGKLNSLEVRVRVSFLGRDKVTCRRTQLPQKGSTDSAGGKRLPGNSADDEDAGCAQDAHQRELQGGRGDEETLLAPKG